MLRKRLGGFNMWIFDILKANQRIRELELLNKEMYMSRLIDVFTISALKSELIGLSKELKNNSKNV